MKQFGLILNGTWRDARRSALTGNDPEQVSDMQKTQPKSSKWVVKSYA